MAMQWVVSIPVLLQCIEAVLPTSFGAALPRGPQKQGICSPPGHSAQQSHRISRITAEAF
jgi:hypothetical protein